jgi:hypothetical protein
MVSHNVQIIMRLIKELNSNSQALVPSITQRTLFSKTAYSHIPVHIVLLPPLVHQLFSSLCFPFCLTTELCVLIRQWNLFLVGMELTITLAGARPVQWLREPTVWGLQGGCVAYWAVFCLYSKSLSWLCFSSVYSPPAGPPGLSSFIFI